jgi:hypothetical protein
MHGKRSHLWHVGLQTQDSNDNNVCFVFQLVDYGSFLIILNVGIQLDHQNKNWANARLIDLKESQETKACLVTFWST